MEAKGHQTTSIVASVALGLLTLSVFYAARNKGPISTVTRFQQALEMGDPATVRSLLLQPIDAISSRILMSQVSTVLRSSVRTAVATVTKDRNNNYAKVPVSFELRRRGLATFSYIVRPIGRRWYIDADATLSQAFQGRRT